LGGGKERYRWFLDEMRFSCEDRHDSDTEAFPEFQITMRFGFFSFPVLSFQDSSRVAGVFPPTTPFLRRERAVFLSTEFVTFFNCFGGRRKAF